MPITLNQAAEVERTGITGELERARNMLNQLHDRLKQLSVHISGAKPGADDPSKAPKIIARNMESTLAEVTERISYCHGEMEHIEKSIGLA